jgi:hypothetical protein
MGGDLGTVDHETDLVVVGANVDGLAHQAKRDRVAIGIETDARFL